LAKKILRNLGFKEGQDSPKGAAKGKMKIRKVRSRNFKKASGKPGKNLAKEDLSMPKRARKKDMIKRCKLLYGKGLDIKKLLSKTGIEYHVPGYQYLGPGTRLKKRLA